MANPEVDNYVTVDADKLRKLADLLGDLNGRVILEKLNYRLTACAAEELFQIFDIRGPTGLGPGITSY